jgi:hypothetical protein
MKQSAQKYYASLYKIYFPGHHGVQDMCTSGIGNGVIYECNTEHCKFGVLAKQNCIFHWAEYKKDGETGRGKEFVVRNNFEPFFFY